MSEFELNAELRQDLGKGASRRLRHEDFVPAVIYGGEKAPVSIMLRHNEVLKAIKNEAFFSHILTMTVAGKAEKVLVRDMQRHPVKPRVLHMDFQRVTGKETLTRQVPLHFINEAIAPGVKIGGGIVNHLLKEVEVRCSASQLPEFIEVDLVNLQLNHPMHLSDLKLPAGVSLVVHKQKQDLPVVLIELPRSAVEKAAEGAAEVAAPAAPEEKK